MIMIDGEWLKKESALLRINIGKIGVGVNEKSVSRSRLPILPFRKDVA